MNIVLAYNESDWSSGWTTFLDGFTMYYTDRKEQDLDFKVSTWLSQNFSEMFWIYQETKLMSKSLK